MLKLIKKSLLKLLVLFHKSGKLKVLLVLTQEDVYNTLELAYQLDGFVMQFDIFSSLLLVLGLKEAVCDLKKNTFLSIGTTFETGNLYISLIVYKNVLFKSEPTIPLAFLIHEKKRPKVSRAILIPH